MILAAGGEVDDMLDCGIKQFGSNHQTYRKSESQPANHVHMQKNSQKDNDSRQREVNAQIALFFQTLKDAGNGVIEGFDHTCGAARLALPACRNDKRSALSALVCNGRLAACV